MLLPYCQHRQFSDRPGSSPAKHHGSLVPFFVHLGIPEVLTAGHDSVLIVKRRTSDIKL